MRLAVLASLIVAFPAHADDLLQKVLQRLGEPQVVRAQFVQERRIADLERPALSRGRIIVSRKDGVLWQIESPIRMTLAFTPEGIVQTGADGVRRRQAQRRGAVETETARLMQGILGASEESLKASFEAKAHGSLDRWTVQLAPRARETARFLREVRLGGGRHLETIEVEETSGTLTTIRMREIRIGTELDDAERDLFKAP